MFLGEPRNITELMFLGEPKNIAPYVSQGSPRNISIIFLGQPRNIIDEHKIFFKKYVFCLPPQLGSLQNRHTYTSAYT
jgi:hypothetical protein